MPDWPKITAIGGFEPLSPDADAPDGRGTMNLQGSKWSRD